MKIAFVKKVPDSKALLTITDSAVSKEPYRILKKSKDVVAAYDGERLIGIGGFQKGKADTEVAQEWAVWIDPQYAKRDIELNMKRLL